MTSGQPTACSTLEMCAVGGPVMTRSYVRRVTTVPVLSSIGQIDVKIFVFSAKLTNDLQTNNVKSYFS